MTLYVIRRTLKRICKKIVPFAVSLALANFTKEREEKRSIIALPKTGFIGLAYEGMSSYLHNKRQKTCTKQ